MTTDHAYTQRLDRLKNDEALVFALIGQDVRLHKSGRNYAGACPFHSGDNPNGFIVSVRAGYWRWHCMTGDCGGGSILDYILKREGLDSIWDAASWLENWNGIAPPLTHEVRPVKPPPSPETLAKSAWRYAENIDRAIPGLDSTGRAFWHSRGLSDWAINQFWLGIHPGFRMRHKGELIQVVTATIPIWLNKQVVNIRHRIIWPDTGGDKYRPHVSGLGHHLVNSDDLADIQPDQDVLIVEGEIKNYFLRDQVQLGLLPDWFPVTVAPTGGMNSFLSQDDQGRCYGDVWLPRFSRAHRIIMLYDYGLEARNKALLTARRFFGRRGYIALLEDKIDDLIIAKGDEGRYRVLEALDAARPAR